MYRIIEEKLFKWKNSKSRKPLIISGARQTGKTYIVKQFANNNYKSIIEVNFEKDNEVHHFFDSSLNAKDIIANLEIYYGTRILPETTLLFFDEIQACPPAISSLKYLCEDLSEYHIICAGSLLGVAINRKFKNKTFSFPVGKIEQIRLFPMNFEEFLLANKENALINVIKEKYKENIPLNDALHNKALKLYRDFISIGGMPEAIKTYVETGSLMEASKISEQIYSDYLNDTAKYATNNEAIKNYNCYDSIARQLLKENKNFKYGEVQKGKNSQYFDSAIEWLMHAGVALKSRLVESPSLPLAFHTNDFLFRIYLSDVGLFRYKANIRLTNVQNIDYRDDMTGILAENYVACELVSHDIPLYYWTGKANSEIEFLVEYNNCVTPIEVKAGIRVTSKSLDIFKNNNSIKYVFRISQKNFGLQNEIKSIPLYAVFCLAEELEKQ